MHFFGTDLIYFTAAIQDKYSTQIILSTGRRTESYYYPKQINQGINLSPPFIFRFTKVDTFYLFYLKKHK